MISMFYKGVYLELPEHEYYCDTLAHIWYVERAYEAAIEAQQNKFNAFLDTLPDLDENDEPVVIFTAPESGIYKIRTGYVNYGTETWTNDDDEVSCTKQNVPFYFTDEELDELLGDKAKEELLLEQFEAMLEGDNSWDQTDYGIWTPNEYQKPKCECGAKYTSNPDYHLDFCPLYEKKN